MRFTLAAVFFSAVLSSVGAVTLQARQAAFPSCANTCVLSPANLFGCDASDNKCLCTNQQYVDETTNCIAQACSAADAASADAFSRSLCEQVGVTLTATPTPSPSAASSGTGSTAAPAASNTSPSSSASVSGSSTSAAPTTTQSGAASTTGANVFIGAAALVLAAFNL